MQNTEQLHMAKEDVFLPTLPELCTVFRTERLSRREGNFPGEQISFFPQVVRKVRKVLQLFGTRRL